MKNKIATRVVTLATAGAMTASSVVSPSVVMASEVDTGVLSENENSDCNGGQGTGSEYRLYCRLWQSGRHNPRLG